MPIESHPSRVRGLKSGREDEKGDFDMVAPFTGAWIEMMQQPSLQSRD